jgi:signal transduction histidine kinase
LKPWLPVYWLITILYAFSFFPVYSFLTSQASVISSMSLLCSVFLLVLLIDSLDLIIVLIAGWGAALALHYFTAPQVFIGEEHIEMLILVIFVIITGTVLNHKTILLQQQRLDGMAAVAGMIAHELRTPLLGIKSGSKAVAQYLPQVLSGYGLAKEHGLLQKANREARLLQLPDINARIAREVDYANTIIDMLLIKAGQKNSLQNCLMEECSMAECLQEAVGRYPFKSDKQRKLVAVHGDFIFTGSRLLMQHVLFNLLKNALYMIETAQKGTIIIWATSAEKSNCLYFKDTAKGMTTAQLTQLFNHFYTTTYMGTGLGLSFCKLVMNRFGGDISCEAKEGEYTQFMLTFPLQEF